MYHEAGKKYRKAQQIVSKLEKTLPKFSEIEKEQNRQIKLQKLKQLLAEVRTKMFDFSQQMPYLQEDRNTTEQEQNEKTRDRQLENIIFFIGTAIGGGQIFSAAYPLIKDTPIQWQPNFYLPLHPFFATLIINNPF